MNKNDQYISLMIVPEDGTGIKKFRCSKRVYRLIRTGIIFLSITLVIGIAAMVRLIQVTLKSYHLERAYAELKIDSIQIKKLAQDLDEMRSVEKRLKTLLGSEIRLPEAPELQNLTTETLLREKPSAIPRKFSQLAEFERAMITEKEKLKHIPTEWPVDGVFLTDQFHQKKKPYLTRHSGIDIIAPAYANIKASADGKVIFAGSDREMGNLIIIDHMNKYVTHYGHNGRIFVRENETIKKGQTIALLGGSGVLSTAPHLHFAIYYEGEPKNPLLFLYPGHIKSLL